MRRLIELSSLKDKKGQGLAEYGLLLAAVTLVTIGILSLLGVQVSDKN